MFFFCFFLFFLFFFFVFLGPRLQHTEVLDPRGGIRVIIADCLHHSSRQHHILTLLSKARHQTGILVDTNQVHYH